jgi:uncharacterized protein
MKIQVGGLTDGTYRYTFRTVPGDLGIGEQFPAEVLVTATVEKTGTQVRLTGAVETAGRFECDRCVAAFDRTIRGAYTMYYLQDPEDAARFEPAEVQLVPPGFSVIDLADDIRQTLLLAVPLKLLCREECAGLCPRCGTNLNDGGCTCTEEIVDTRWETLRRLRTN